MFLSGIQRKTMDPRSKSLRPEAWGMTSPPRILYGEFFWGRCMEIFDAIRARRGIRRYTEKKSDDTIVNNILAAGMMASGWGISGRHRCVCRYAAGTSSRIYAAAFCEYRIPSFHFLFCASAIRRKVRKAKSGSHFPAFTQNAGSFSILGMNSLF